MGKKFAPITTSHATHCDRMKDLSRWLCRGVIDCCFCELPQIPEAQSSLKYLISIYTIFTTLTSIGYGDIVMVTAPGELQASHENHRIT